MFLLGVLYLFGVLKNVNFDGYVFFRVYKMCVIRIMIMSFFIVGVFKYIGSYKIKFNVDFECD